ncbi:MAG: hypothetical protein KDA99_08715, partial [Planctomycetales bacterium]|nr:hypothetical protein [Planctomycetales bacterium]
RTYLLDTGDGFNVTDRRGSRGYYDEDVNGFAWLIDRDFSNPSKISVIRKGGIWVADDPDPIRLNSKYWGGDVDPVGELLHRISESLLRRCEESTRSGGQLDGKGWSFGNQRLSINKAGDQRELPLSQLTAIDVLRNNLCLWCQGRDEPTVELGMDDKNVFVLHRLLYEHLKDRPRSDDSEPQGLGRILFAKETTKTQFLIVSVVGLAFLVGAAGCAATQQWLAAWIAGAIGLALVIAAATTRKNALRCHAHGLFYQTAYGSQEIRYSDIATFTYHSVRMYYNGVYTGTNVSMSFMPAEGKPLKYSTNAKDITEFESLRDHVATVVGYRMLQQFQNGQAVTWTKNATFHPDHLEYHPTGFVGRKAPEQVPYSEITGTTIEHGSFFLWRTGVNKSVFRESTSMENFFPGFVMFSSREFRETTMPNR